MARLARGIFWSLALSAALGSAASADQRSYVWTYEYRTVPRGEAEIETYYTASAPAKHDLEGIVTAEHQIEVEIGMNDRFDFALYHVFVQGPGESLEYEGYKLRWRYRVGEKGRSIVDPLVYFEYAGAPDFSEHALEGKVILARDLGRINVAFNGILEVEFEDGDSEAEPGYAAGASYAANDIVRLGLEAKGSEHGHFMGPVVSHGSERFWAAIGSAIALSDSDDGEDELQIRMILGLGL